MNTNPDDTTLALWLDDELEGDELSRVEAWAAEHPEQLAAREEVRRWRRMISASIPAAEEPPAAEFFNERIQHAIRESTHASGHAHRIARTWSHLWMPLAACAGMVLAFWLGMSTHQKTVEITNHGNPDATLPNLYTPLQGVEAESFTSASAAATVIVLTGIDAIPDSVDFSATAASQRWREIDSTAGNAPTAEP